MSAAFSSSPVRSGATVNDPGVFGDISQVVTSSRLWNLICYLSRRHPETMKPTNRQTKAKLSEPSRFPPWSFLPLAVCCYCPNDLCSAELSVHLPCLFVRGLSKTHTDQAQMWHTPGTKYSRIKATFQKAVRAPNSLLSHLKGSRSAACSWEQSLEVVNCHSSAACSESMCSAPLSALLLTSCLPFVKHLSLCLIKFLIAFSFCCCVENK